MAMKPKKETFTVTSKGNKTTKTWEYDDGSGSSVTTTNPSKNLDSKFGRAVPKPSKPTPKATVKPKVTSKPINKEATKKAKVAELIKPTSKATAKATAKPKAMTEAQKQAKAMDKLMEKRKAASKKTGSWPNYKTN